MKQLTRLVLAVVFLLVSSASGYAVQSAQDPQPKQEIGPDILRNRYKQLWESVGKVRTELPPIVVHLGASAGNRIAVWAKSVHGRKAVARDWVITCGATDAITVEEQVHDWRFGVSKLAITRNDRNDAPLLCTLSMGGSSASLVIPVLSLSPNQGRFSFLAYSCNEPFSTAHGGGILARDLSLWLRMDARASGETSREQLPFRPQFVLGVGDQIYVDPDPDGNQPLAFFNGDRSDNFLVKNDRESLYKELDIVYQYNFSLPPLARALSKLPSFMMWDDHEIRDGWGSQRDELINPDMLSYFPIARRAFIAHQLLRSFPPGEMDNNKKYKALVDGTDTLHLQFSHGDRTHVLMLDSRSTRGRGEIFEDTARQAVRQWLGRGRKGQGDLYVLTVGAPLFPSRTRTGVALSTMFEPEIQDDVRDGWDSDENKYSRSELVKMLNDHFGVEITDRLLVISGDVHYSSLYFLSLNDRVVGHEVVTSGIAHSLPWKARSGNWLLDSGNKVGQFEVRPAGKINDSASFAELIVDPGATHQPPKVDLVFHLNGTRVKGGWAIGNTNLLAPRTRPLWYHTYRYDYADPLEHLAAAGLHADALGDVPAGTVVPLPLSLPRVKTRPSLILWPFGRNVVKSSIQSQSVFCTVAGTDYNSELAESWDLKELTRCCMRLRR